MRAEDWWPSRVQSGQNPTEISCIFQKKDSYREQISSLTKRVCKTQGRPQIGGNQKNTMKAIRFLSVLAIAAGASIALAQVIPNQYIAVFKDDVRNHPAAAQSMAAQHGLALGHVYQFALKGFAFRGSPQAAAALARRPQIAYVEPDQVCHTCAQDIPTGINRVDVDATGVIDGTDNVLDVDIAVIDTGIGPHVDLRVQGGVRILNGVEYSNYADDNGHGTHVAGTAAAIDNGLGVVGAAPGARLWAVKVLDSTGSGSWSDVIKGIDWVTARATVIEVANMSLGGGLSTAVNEAVARGTAAGIVFVVAAGNDAADAQNFSPASEPTAITVSAMADSDGLPDGVGSSFYTRVGRRTVLYAADDSWAPFSNFGPAVDICAPGVAILSTVPGGYDGTYSGTSMASPHVAGAAALYMAGKNPRPSVTTVTAALETSGWQEGEAGYYFLGDPDSYAEPLLNVGRLMGVTPVNNPPTVTIASPANGASFDYGTAIAFVGSAVDAENENLTGALKWTSSLDGTIGQGGSISKVLTAGTHLITASVTDSGGMTGNASVTITVNASTLQPPAKPSNLTANAVSRSVINLTWIGNSDNETGFKIERSTNGSTFVQIGTTGADTTTYSSGGLKRNTTYSYRVRAYNAAGDSAYSDTASATTPAR